MHIWYAIVLGIIQGVTEFLPVSSSGHLAVAQIVMGFKEPELVLDIALHVGTLMAVLIVFRQDLLSILTGVVHLRKSRMRDGKLDRSLWLLFLIIIGSIPTAIVGFLGQKWFESLFSSLTAVAISFMITGTILWLTRFARNLKGRPVEDMKVIDALSVGFAQGVAIAPGISRSGTTIASGLLLGLDRELAARYSFLLFIPAVTGATLLELPHWQASSFSLVAVLAGSVTAMLVGYLALRSLLTLIRKGAFHYFSYYCWTIGLLILVFKFFG